MAGNLLFSCFFSALINIFNAKYTIHVALECSSPGTLIWLNWKVFLKQPCQVLLEIMH